MHSLPIKIEGIERRKRSTGLLHIIAGFFLIVNAAEYYKELQFRNFLSVSPFFLGGLISLVYGAFRKKFDDAAHYNHLVRMLQFLMFSVMGVLMIRSAWEYRTISLFIWAVACILLLFTERKVFHDAHLTFSQNSIAIPGYFSNKIIPWTVIDNVVVRPDFITIHYPGNKYLQYEVLSTVQNSDIETINAFCRQRLQQGAEVAEAVKS